MANTVLEEAILRYKIPNNCLAPISGGHFTQVYEFTKEGKEFILFDLGQDSLLAGQSRQSARRGS